MADFVPLIETNSRSGVGGCYPRILTAVNFPKPLDETADPWYARLFRRP